MRKRASKSDREYMAKVSELPCIICAASPPSEVHHITHCGRRLGHDHTLPLCTNCHRGNDGFSGINRGAWDKSLNNQLALLERVRGLM